MLQIDDNIVLKPEPQAKVLGITVDNKLNFDHHVCVIYDQGIETSEWSCWYL